MFRTRVISAVVASAILLGIVVWGSEAVFASAVFIVVLIGMHEFYKCLEQGGYRPIKHIGYICTLAVPALGFKAFSGLSGGSDPMTWLLLGIFGVMVLLFLPVVFMSRKYNMVDAAVTLFGAFYVVFLFIFLILVRSMENGSMLIWLVFIGAWATDTFAYFGGRLFGRVKLIPDISPKKTVEGSIGGIIGCIGMMLLYGLLLNRNGMVVPPVHLVFIGIICSVISQVGDLSASAIKRFVKVKDYGSIMPGHGGVLDRFDSILFVAPVIYFYINLIIK